MDIAIWLRGLGLQRYEPAFRESEITAAVLPELTEADLKELGLPLGPRKLVLKAIASLPKRLEPEPAPPPKATLREAERRQLTVMFVDLVGSTALSARLDPEDMREVIRAYQNTVAGEIGRLEGHVAKFMGDGVLAYFGWPRAHEDEAERAVRAGLAVARAVGQLETPTNEALAARIGIATGLVVVGDLVGEGAAQEEAVVGDTPNLAARLHGLAEPYQIVIAEGTRRLLHDLFDLADLGAQRVKGIAEPVAAFLVLGERPLKSRFEAHSGPALQPMVGRDQELALLLERWSQAKSGEGQGVLLVGEAGIGKSRISHALLDALADEPHFRVRYQCSPYHTDSALWPVIQQLNHAAGLHPDDPVEVKLDKLEALLDQADGRNAAPLVADLLGLDGGARYAALEITPETQRTRTLEALAHQLLGLAARQPVLLVLEDAHWIDPTTLELFEQCLDIISDARVLMLLTSRPDRQPDLAAHPHVTRLTLNRLSRAGVEAIVVRLGGGNLPAETIDAIIARTDGVPLFVEELTKAILDAGEVKIPASLYDSLMARLDRIPEVKEVAQIAACIGREFDYALLAAVVDRSEPDLHYALDRLAAAELIFRRGRPPQATYTFKHSLVQDAAYQSLLRRRRQEFHLQVGRALEQRFSERAAAEPELIAHHLVAGGRATRSVPFWRAAVEIALAKGANREASAFCRSGLQASLAIEDERERDRARCDFLQLQQGADYSQGDVEHLFPIIVEAEQCARRLEDPHRLALALNSKTYNLTSSGRVAEAIDVARECVAISSQLDVQGPWIIANTMLARSLYAAGRYQEAVEQGELVRDALGEDIERGSPSGTAMNQTVSSRVWLCFMLTELGRFADALANITKAHALIPHVAAPEHVTLWAALAHARLASVTGDDETVLERLLPALDVCAQAYPVYMGRLAMSLGPSLVALGQPVRGIELLERATEITHRQGFKFLRALLLAQFSAALLTVDEVVRALEIGREGIADAERTGEAGNRAWAQLRAGEAARALGRSSEGTAMIKEAGEEAHRRSMLPLLRRCAQALEKRN